MREHAHQGTVATFPPFAKGGLIEATPVWPVRYQARNHGAFPPFAKGGLIEAYNFLERFTGRHFPSEFPPFAKGGLIEAFALERVCLNPLRVGYFRPSRRAASLKHHHNFKGSPLLGIQVTEVPFPPFAKGGLIEAWPCWPGRLSRRSGCEISALREGRPH